jgi:hypothetical protein
LFELALADWWGSWRDRLPRSDTNLAELQEDEIETLSAAFDDLASRGVALMRDGVSVRSLGSTAAAKALYVLRPFAVPPWDDKIARRLYGARDAAAFSEHLHQARQFALALLDEAGGETSLLAAVGRPGASLAKLLDEYWVATILM